MISELKDCSTCKSNNKSRIGLPFGVEKKSEGLMGVMQIQNLKCNNCGLSYQDNLEFIPS